MNKVLPGDTVRANTEGHYKGYPHMSYYLLFCLTFKKNLANGATDLLICFH